MRAIAGPGLRAVEGVDLPLLMCWDCGFECRQAMDICLLWLFCVIQVKVTATGRSLVQGVLPSVCVLLTVIKCNHSPLNLK